MLKIPRSITLARRLGVGLLALAIVLPCKGGNPPTLTTLYSFDDLKDGSFPEAGLVVAASGALYGTTSSSGSGWGSVFQLVSRSGTWTETTIYSFTGGGDGSNPIADLAIGKNNILYGTTYGGGAYGYGTVFQVSPVAGGGWSQKVLYSFAGSGAGGDGAYPAAGVKVVASSGILYGTTYSGGTAGLGTAFALTPSVAGWSERVIYNFQGGADGANPLADLTVGNSGQLFGTTSQGGSVTNSSGTFVNGGTVFELTNSEGVWTENQLYTFTGGSDGGFPESALIQAPSGVLYGSTFWGGTPAACAVGEYAQGCGTVYQLTPRTGGGTPWTETVLHTFTSHSPDGAHPYRNMALNGTGILFGATFSGGANVDVCYSDSYNGCGTVFELKPPSTPGGAWTKSNLMALSGSPGGGTPNGVILSKGSLYGTTIVGGTAGGYGTVFLLVP
jgi:uncharacterized repeat protein (TIGR03803 family)